ncbi:hypothetical protein BGX29_008984 [Mortierella sp. GBA35]|nr:hypothetical protein BGX29_008984 [Mortierella sp. GBA35]
MHQRPSQPSPYSVQGQQQQHLQFMSRPVPGTHSPNTHSIPSHQSSNRPFQGQWSRKRGLFSDPELSAIKKRNRGSETEGLFGWGDMLAATTHSPGVAPAHFHVEASPEYFDRQSTHHSNPATPPMDPGVSPLAPTFTRFQPSDYQPSLSRSIWGESGQGEGHGQLNSTRSTFGRTGMDVEASRQGAQFYHGQGYISGEPRQMSTIRSISPAPSSPGGSADELDVYSRMQDSTSMASVEGLVPPAPEKKATSGRGQFVMGFRPGCEKCQRREKGHFAHFS